MKKEKTILILAGGLVVLFMLILPFYMYNSAKERAKARLMSTDTQGQVAGNTPQTTFRGPFEKISFDKVTVDNNVVNIVGSTDLPNGSVLIVDFNVSGRSDAELYIGVQEKAIVTNSKFATFMKIPQREEYKKGPYEVSASFTPRGQSDKVIELVGVEGENLAGALVDSSPDRSFKTMYVTEVLKDLQLSVTAPTYIFQQPSEFIAGSAEQALAEYVLSWKNQDWARMVNYTQKTWVNKQGDSAGILQAQYDFKILKGFHDVKVVSGNNVSKDITFIVEYEKSTNVISKKQITARVIKEDGSYSPSEDGQWGVNPISMMNETSM